MEKTVLQMTGIQKAFFGIPVLRGIDFTLNEGRVHAIMGGNGAGKSTLMKILTGVYKKDEGTIQMFGEPVIIQDYATASKRGIRMIFQELSDIPTMTVWENIFLNHEWRKGVLLDKKGMRQKAIELLKRFDMDIDADELMGNLGVGYCQMIEIVKALSMDAKILVMDEPTASLSSSEVEVLFSLIKKLKEQKVSVVYISHRMGEILRIADDLTVLKDGQVTFSGPTEGMTIDQIVNYMLGKKEKNQMEWHENLYTECQKEIMCVERLTLDDRIKNISFSLNQGEVLGIAGLLGSGRTEILESIFGIRKPVSGKITVSGEEIELGKTADAIRNGIALVPEDRRREGLVLAHSIYHNTILPSIDRLRRRILIDKKQAVSMVNESVASLNIKTHNNETLVQRLSGGNQQKVVVGKWLQTAPKILLLDEPTAGIDIGAKGEILNIVRNYSNKGNAVIFVSSEISELLAVADRVLVLHNGKILKEFKHDEIESEEVLENAIQG